MMDGIMLFTVHFLISRCGCSERIRAKEIPVRDRVFLLKPEHPSTAMARTQTYMARSAVAPNALPQRALTVA